MSKEFWEEVCSRTGRKCHTVIAAEGKKPLASQIKIPTQDWVPHNHGKNITLIKRYDAPIVIIVKLEHGTIWILQENGTPCLASDNPQMRDAHWYLSSIMCRPGIKKHMPKWWMIAGFWTLNARSEIYDLPTPYQVFEVGDGEQYVEPYEDLRAWCDTFGLHICPRLDIPQSDHEGQSIKCVVHLSNDLGFVEERIICGGAYDNTARYRTNNMPYGLVQCELPRITVNSERMSIYKMLQDRGLKY